MNTLRSFRRARCTGQLVDPLTGRLWARRSTCWLRALIPELAARLADRLESWEDSPPVTELDAGIALNTLAERYECLAVSEWRRVCELLALDGMRLGPALRTVGIPSWLFRAYTRSEPRLRADLKRCLSYRGRRQWPAVLVEEILNEVADSSVSLKHAVVRRGLSKVAYISLLRAIWRTPELREKYLRAKASQAGRLDVNLYELDDTAVLALGRRGVRKAQHAIRGLIPLRLRKMEANQRRAASAKLDPAAERLRVARKRAGRRG